MYVASKFKGGIKFLSAAYSSREEASAAFFAEYPQIKSCSTSDAYERDGRWHDRNTDIRFHDRPYAA